MDFNKAQIDNLIQDISYLQDEFEALKYVIHTVPFDEKPAGKDSILDMIALIDHAQKVYYRPFVELVSGVVKPEDEVDDDYRKSFVLDMEKYEGSVDNLLDKIVKHRAGLLSVLNKLNVIDWNRKGKAKGRYRSIFEIVNDMIDFEKNQLKMVADRVMSIERER